MQPDNRLVSIIDRAIKPMVYSISHYIAETDAKNLACFYDPDWGGFPSQAIMNRIFEKTQEVIPQSHWIAYDNVRPAVDWMKKKKLENIFFVDYEPHDEFKEICKNAARIGIFGHHAGRDDTKKLESDDPRVTYFNPRFFVPEKIRLRGEKEPYGRGIPITYALMKAAERFDVNVQRLGLLGLINYGYYKLWKEIPDRNRCSSSESSKIRNQVTILSSYKLDRSDLILDCLTKGSISGIRKEIGKQKLYRQKYLAITEAIDTAVKVGDVKVFLINSPFQIIKTFVSDLERNSSRSHCKTYICINHGKNPKASIRTKRDISVPELLKVTFEHFPKVEKNYGGHPKAGGFTAAHVPFYYILSAFINRYLEATGQEESIDPEMLEMKLANHTSKTL